MIRPIRLQRSRRPGFDLQEISRAANGLEAVIVDRRTPWGNPFDFRHVDFCWLALSYGCRGDAAGRQDASVRAFREWVTPIPGKRLVAMERGVVLEGPPRKGRRRRQGAATVSMDIGPRVRVGPPPTVDAIRAALAGRNLACWCAPGCPCHADVLLEIANP